VTEVWLKLEMDNGDDGKEFSVKRDGETIFRGRLAGDDTTLHDENLLPSHEYSYVAYRLANGKEIYSSELLKVTTMDTTSHEFSWEIYTFGGVRGSSVLRDVCIIDENDIWAVGEIHTEDTDCWNEDSTQWIPSYNAVHWNGVNWELVRIYYDFKVNFPDGYSDGPSWAPIDAIFATEAGDIWIKSGTIHHFDGQKWHQYQSLFSVNKIWGTGSNNMYFVGYGGTIVHYDGSRWRKLEAPLGQDGTDLDIYDIWGEENQQTGEYEILCVAAKKFESYNRAILKIKDQQVATLADNGIPWSLSGIWFIPNQIYWVVGGGIYYKRNIMNSSSWTRIDKRLTEYYINSIRGNEINDIIAVGAFGEVLHFNGVSWKSQRDKTRLSYGTYYRVDVRANLICAVGEDASSGRSKALILRGTHF